MEIAGGIKLQGREGEGLGSQLGEIGEGLGSHLGSHLGEIGVSPRGEMGRVGSQLGEASGGRLLPNKIQSLALVRRPGLHLAVLGRHML